MATTSFSSQFAARAASHDGDERRQVRALLPRRKAYDLLLRAQATAKANGRDVIRPFDLPITKGLQESMHAFKALDEQIELRPILEGLAALPQLDLGYEDETAVHSASGT